MSGSGSLPAALGQSTCLRSACAGCGPAASQKAVDPKSFFRSSISSHDVILLGAKHNQPSTSLFLIDILPVLAGFGVTHVGLEITSDQQPKIDNFLHTGSGLDEIEIFHAIDRPEYRRFLDSVRLCELKPVALDLPGSMWNTSYTRDEWMARTISGVFQQESRVKMLVIAGNLHTLKRVDWINPTKTDVFLPGYLSKYEPELKSLSVLSDYDDSPSQCCKVRKKYESFEKPLVLNAMGLDLRPGVLDIIAAKPLKVDQIADAVMIY
ncbi:MAG: hypothetical protein ABSH41_10075 [Syntrophobacteraceae bacterium]|jgi:hypothetical protein